MANDGGPSAAAFMSGDAGSVTATTDNLRAESELFELNAAIAAEQLRDLRENRDARNDAAVAKARADKLRIAINASILCMAAAAVLALVGMTISAARSRAVIIEAFDAATALAPSGITGKTTAAEVQDAFSLVQRNVRSRLTKRDIANGWTQEIEVEVPKTGMSIGQISRLLKAWLGNDTHVGGTLVQLAPDRIALTVRGDNIPAKRFEGALTELPTLTTRAAEYVYGEAEPALFTLYLAQSRRYPEVDAFARVKIGRVAAADKVRMLGNWASALGGMDRYGEAIDKLRAALRIDPTAFSRWDNLVLAKQDGIGVEPARREAERMMAAYEALPEGKRPPAIQVQNGLMLFNDWQRISAATLEDDALAPGGTGLSDNRGYLVENALALHDYAQAQQLQAQLDLPPREMRTAILSLEGNRRRDQGDVAGALPWFERAAAMARGTEKAASRTAELAVVLAQLARAAEARTIFAALPPPNGYYNRVMRLQALAGRDNVAATNAAYRVLIASAPSMPDGYESWGRTKLVDGDYAGATRMFLRAAQRAPHWGDAWEGCGKARAALRQWAGAVECYEKAVQYAPAWPGLQARLAAARTEFQQEGKR